MNNYFLITTEKKRWDAIECLKKLDLTKNIEVWFKKHQPKRSYMQNRLMWMWLDIMAGETGYTPLDLHEIFKVKFLGIETKKLFGDEYIIARSTTGLDTKEFTDYLSKIQALAADMGITLPTPEDLKWAAFGAS